MLTCLKKYGSIINEIRKVIDWLSDMKVLVTGHRGFIGRYVFMIGDVDMVLMFMELIIQMM